MSVGLLVPRAKLSAVPRQPTPPIAAALSFVDAINQQDLDRLTALMSEDHRLCIFDEPPVIGREQNRQAWNGYFTSFADYVIYPSQITEQDGIVAILGVTTGSHLGLPDDEERQESLLWLARVQSGRVVEWSLVQDTPEARERHGFQGARSDSTAVTLCVLLWAAEGRRDALGEYEQQVLALLADHGAGVLQRIRHDGPTTDPDEVQLLEFPSDNALAAYLQDPRRTALAARRDEVVARTDVLRVEPFR